MTGFFARLPEIYCVNPTWENEFVTLYYDYYYILPIAYMINNVTKTLQIALPGKMSLVWNLRNFITKCKYSLQLD